jgi:hypothetical protein
MIRREARWHSIGLAWHEMMLEKNSDAIENWLELDAH